MLLLSCSVAVGLRQHDDDIHPGLPLQAHSLAPRRALPEVHEQWRSGQVAVFDARSEGEFSQSHIPKAIRLGPDNFLAAPWQGLDPNLSIIVYCSSPGCGASERVAEQLIRYGFRRVSVLDGGFRTWREAGYEVEP